MSLTDTVSDARAEWSRWHESRLEAARAPLGVAALTGTHWMTTTPAAIEGLEGLWSTDGDGVCVSGLGGAGARLMINGFPGDEAGDEVYLGFDGIFPSEMRIGELLLRAVRFSGGVAVRVWDPGARTRTGFRDILAFDYDPGFAVTASFEPFDEPRPFLVDSVDGGQRELSLDGRAVFQLQGVTHSLNVSSRRGNVHAVFGDTTNNDETFIFRFLDAEAPDESGGFLLDFNRAYLSPCAFAEHYMCPFPPAGNRLPVPVRAGERFVIREDA